MKSKNLYLAFLLLTLMSKGLEANVQSEIYFAYINNRMELWKSIIDSMDAVQGKSNDMLLELINYQYGYVGYCIGFNRQEEAGSYLYLALKNIEYLEKENYESSTIYAYKSAFYGFKIILNKLCAPIIGLKSIEAARSSIELDKENYLGYVQLGNIEFYMPSAFGGSKKEALEFYLKAREIIEKKPENIHENWNYLSLLVVIGQSHYYLNEYDSAKSVYDRILELEPGFLYVKNELYPQLLKKMEIL